jgi:predicted NAD/FAD-dependent oxidoreductase
VFVNALNQWILDGVAAEWKSPIKVVDVSNNQVTDPSTQNSRYVGVDGKISFFSTFNHSGMNSIAQYLSKGLNIQLNTRVTSITHNSKWSLKTEKGETFENFDILIVSIPCPQAETLLTEKVTINPKMSF